MNLERCSMKSIVKSKKYHGKIISIIVIFLCINFWSYVEFSKLKAYHITIIIIGMILFFIKFNIKPQKRKYYKKRISILMGGYDLIKSSGCLFMLQVIYSIIYLKVNSSISIIICEIVSALVIFLVLWNGILRVVLTSTQLGIKMKLALFFGWWIPILNIFIFFRTCRIVRREFLFEISKMELNNNRLESEICRTKYPILLVHGIFWRDWQVFNYWGRIPGELIKNGAIIYYGNQHSSAPMEICGQDLKDQILRIVDQEKCQKVNIIGHSKGGLDARYTASCMGIEQYIASVTTIGTPHGGSYIVELIFSKIPDKLLRKISKIYNKTYKKMGDTSPDFYSGIYDLRPKSCEIFNKKAVDKENIYYQSIFSKMNGFFSGGFPLNIGYLILKKSRGINDGFVSETSSIHGKNHERVESKKKRGISHGDMIDLMRENIDGFDVCEYYVQLVKKLKEKGF